MIKRTLFLVALAGICGMSLSCKKQKSLTTGWDYNDKKMGGFEKHPYREQATGPNLVYIPGGTFTMGLLEADVTYEADAVPRRETIQDFYMDETEVANIDYLEYLYWLQRVYVDYPQVLEQAKPDTLVWRDKLAYNEPFVKYYFRHPAYQDYPVVGVTWVQANNYCQWRTDRVNEEIMIERGNLAKNPDQKNEDNFNTEAYLVGKYDGKPGHHHEKDYSASGSSKGRRIKMEDGVLEPDYRLPTEAEWEYAALAEQGNAKFENVNERRIYAWDGLSLRQNDGRYVGKFRCNFKRGRGDNQGVSEDPNDGAYITAPVISYWPNDFGLYNMSGNVNEWVLDVYRPLTFEDASDFNSFRGNVFKKVVRDQDGYVADKDSLGRIKYTDVTVEENANRRNYRKADNIGSKDEMTYNNDQEGYDYGNNTLISDHAHVYKGGGWNDRAFWMSPGSRRFLDENQSTNELGFRCAMIRVGTSKRDYQKPKARQ